MSDKELLIKDLCGRLPYNVVVNCTEEDDEKTNFNCFLTPEMIKDIGSVTAKWNYKPYLRPITSMTKEECAEEDKLYGGDDSTQSDMQLATKLIDYYNSHYIDYRGLIEKGLALEAVPGIYNI